MMFRWINRHVDLGLLVERVKLFFEVNGFKTRVDKLKDGWLVLATRSFEGKPKVVFAKVWGNSGDFTVDFSFGGYRRELTILGSFITLFGVGALFRREFKWMEFFEALERNFWAYVENAVNDLQGKALRE